MQALRLDAYGSPGALALARIPRPAPGPGEVLVRVRAAGVNPVDWKIADGFGDFLGLSLPATLGCELAGEVAGLGDGVEGFDVGDAVFGYVALQRCGAFAEYAIALPHEIAALPDGIGFDEAATLPVAGETSWQALVETAKLQSGERVLVHAAAGGVGSMGVQLAKALGAEVVGTASAANEAFVRELGADRFIDYRKTPFEEAAGPVDVVYDTVGGDTLARSFKVLSPGGRLVSIVDPPDPAMAEAAGVTAGMIAVLPEGEQLARLAGMMSRGELRANVARRYPLSDVLGALDESRGGHVRGKLIVNP